MKCLTMINGASFLLKKYQAWQLCKSSKWRVVIFRQYTPTPSKNIHNNHALNSITINLYFLPACKLHLQASSDEHEHSTLKYYFTALGYFIVVTSKSNVSSFPQLLSKPKGKKWEKRQFSLQLLNWTIIVIKLRISVTLKLQKWNLAEEITT